MPQANLVAFLCISSYQQIPLIYHSSICLQTPCSGKPPHLTSHTGERKTAAIAVDKPQFWKLDQRWQDPRGSKLERITGKSLNKKAQELVQESEWTKFSSERNIVFKPLWQNVCWQWVWQTFLPQWCFQSSRISQMITDMEMSLKSAHMYQRVYQCRRLKTRHKHL